jgi:hypothetical protein
MPVDFSALIAVGIIVDSERDRRALEFLVTVCGTEVVLRGCAELPGRTRPYVSNIAKALGVVIPDEVAVTPRAEGRRQLAEIKKLLGQTVKRSR